MRLTEYRQESFINITKLCFQEQLCSHVVRHFGFSFRVLLLSALLMLASCATFPINNTQKDDTQCELSGTNSKQISDNWLFRLDPNNVGLSNGWQYGVADKNDWIALIPGEPWEASGFNYDGVAWYNTKITLPDWSDIYLGFGKIDDLATVWINGKQVEAWVNLGPGVMLVDLSKYGKADDNIEISIRIVDKGGYGGIKQPVIIGQHPRLVITPLQYTALQAYTHPDWPMPGWSKNEPYSWTMTGNSNGSEEALVSSDGSVTPWAKAPRTEIWVYNKNKELLTYADPNKIEFSLSGSQAPIPTWKWKSADVIVTNTLFGDHTNEAVRWKVTLENYGQKRIDLNMMLSVRPFATNANSVPICQINTQHKQKMWVNNKPFLAAAIPAKHTGAGQLSDTMYAALNGTVPSRKIVTDSTYGSLAAILSYPVNLNPGETKDFHFAFPETPESGFPNVRVPIDQQLNKALDHWEQETGAVTIALPDSSVQNALTASLGYLLLSLDPDGPHPGPLAHDAVWVRDAAYTGLAALQFGHTENVRSTITSTFESQEREGRIPPIRGKNAPWDDNEWDSQGQSIFLASQYYRYTNNDSQVREWYPNIRLAALYISNLISKNTSLNSATKGLLPPSKSAEDLGPADWHHYWDNFWAVTGLEQAAFIAKELDQHDDAIWMTSEANALRRAILDSIRVVMGPDPAYIPGAIESTTGSAMARGTVSALWPNEVLPRNTELIAKSFDTYHKLWIEPDNGGFRHLGGQFWPYGGLELAHAYLKINRADVLHQILSWTLRNQTLPGTYAWAEQVNPVNGGFSGGDMPHAWAAASFATLVREMLMSEQDGALVLLQGAPEWWLVESREITLNNAPTHYGNINFHTSNDIIPTEYGWDGKLTITLSGASPPNGYRWTLPNIPDAISGPSGMKIENGVLIIPSGNSEIELDFKP